MRLLPEKELAPRLAVKPGVPYSESAVSTDAALLQSLYVDKGFVDAKVEATTRFTAPEPPQGGRADVTYTVTEGKSGPLRQDDRAREQPHEALHHRGPARERRGRALLPDEAPRHPAGARPPRRLRPDRRHDVRDGSRDDVEERPRDGLGVAAVGAHVRGRRRVQPPEQRVSERPALAPPLARRDLQQPLRPRPGGRASRAGLRTTTPASSSRRATARSSAGRSRSRSPIYNTKDMPSPAYDVKRKGTFLQGEYRLSKSLRTGLRVQYELVEPSSDPGLGADQRGNTGEPHRVRLERRDLGQARRSR